LFLYIIWLISLSCVCFVFFFFQAEDGIRDATVTGVQTCALPILCERHRLNNSSGGIASGTLTYSSPQNFVNNVLDDYFFAGQLRSEERRVGKECRSWWWAEHEKKEMNDEMRT